MVSPPPRRHGLCCEVRPIGQSDGDTIVRSQPQDGTSPPSSSSWQLSACPCSTLRGMMVSSTCAPTCSQTSTGQNLEMKRLPVRIMKLSDTFVSKKNPQLEGRGLTSWNHVYASRAAHVCRGEAARRILQICVCVVGK